ncbi:serine/arginine repetitive matrix protein 1 [Dorcoceras hygrometricum]|uniref:Serine/arginine repetitive matrix protein 1 n=1 Tax=Dorcoceras hygrometricum TaxID=472368 RepID=A0A2Z7DER3_9LAMI|nr:serine/arginine repetitive matrix protein 1 [Dorcoceras hygrometricum]
MAPSVPRTRATAALRMKQIDLDNQDRTIRRLRAQLATERRGLATTKKELEETQVALEASHKVITGLTEIGLSMSRRIERKDDHRIPHTISKIHSQKSNISSRQSAAEILADSYPKFCASDEPAGARLRKNSCNRVTAGLRSNSRIRKPYFRLRSVHV